MLEKINHKSAPKEVVNALVTLYHQGKYDDVLSRSSQLIKEYPQTFVLHNIIGAISFEKGHKEIAIEHFRKVIKLRPHHPHAYNNLGATLIDIGEYQEAKSNLKKAIELQPDYAEAYNNLGNAYKEMEEYNEAILVYEKAIELNPQYYEAYNNLGAVLGKNEQYDEAIEAYNKTILLKPDFAEAYNNMGIALKEQGKLEEAIEKYKKALSLKPDHAESYINIGVVLQGQGKFQEAIEAYNKALLLKPDFAEAYNNIGNVFKDQGKLGDAIKSYKKALSFKPDLAETYINMGGALWEQCKMEEAIESYKGTHSIDANNADAYWYLYGTAQNFVEAKKWIKKCLRADPNHLEAKLTLSALQYYEGNMSNFNTYMKSKLKENAHMRSFNWVFNLPKLPPLYFHRWSLFDQMIVMSKKDRPFYEFGVWRGEAFKYLIKTFKKGYGFDTFEGLPEDWHNEKAGTYSSEGNIPKVAGGEFIVGKFEDSLPEFFAKKRPMASIINFDADLYSSTICALNFSKPVIDRHTILIFDEFLINENWEQDEYKALEEFCNKNHFTYEVLAISFFSKQVAVRLLGF